MLGYCGINCAECPAYKGTVNTDVGLLEEVAGSYWDGVCSAPDWVCLGCTPADQGFLAKDCATCKIRGCAIEKKVQNCAACDSYESCAVPKDLIKAESAEAIGKRMDWLHARFRALRSERAAAPKER
jgi:hypothetical protein